MKTFILSMNAFLLSLLTFLLIVDGILFTFVFFKIIDNDCNHCEMSLTDKLDIFTYGVYYKNSHYCVWTKNLTWDDINDTEYHEACHDQVYKNPVHFCEDYFYLAK